MPALLYQHTSPLQPLLAGIGESTEETEGVDVERSRHRQMPGPLWAVSDPSGIGRRDRRAQAIWTPRPRLAMDATSQTGMGPWHIPTTTQHNTTTPAHHNHTPPGLGDGRTAHLPPFRKELASALWPCAHFPFPIARLTLSSVRSSEQNEGTPGAFPREPSTIKTGLPSFSATLTSTDTLPTITECRRTRTEESLKRVAPVPDMASGPCCCEPGMVNGRRRTQR